MGHRHVWSQKPEANDAGFAVFVEFQNTPPLIIRTLWVWYGGACKIERQSIDALTVRTFLFRFGDDLAIVDHHVSSERRGLEQSRPVRTVFIERDDRLGLSFDLSGKLVSIVVRLRVARYERPQHHARQRSRRGAHRIERRPLSSLHRKDDGIFRMPEATGSVRLARIELVLPTVQFPEEFMDFRMLHRLPGLVGNEVLFGDVGDVIARLVLG